MTMIATEGVHVRAEDLLPRDEIQIDGRDWRVRNVRPIGDVVALDLHGVHVGLPAEHMVSLVRRDI
jgi:hypothetical protein